MKVLKQLRFYLLLALASLIIYLLIQVYELALPIKLFILVILLFTTVFSLCLCLSYQTKKWIQWLGIVITIISCVGVYYSGDVFNEIHDTLVALEDNSKEDISINYDVIINKTYDLENGEVVPDLLELGDKKFGVLEMGNTSYNRDIIKDIRTLLNKDVEFTGIKTYKEATEKLINGDIEVLIINEAIRDMFEVDLNTISTVVKNYQFTEVKEENRHQAKVTQEPFIVYITGIDTDGALSTVARSDVNKILVINPLTKDILVISIPRDFYLPISCLNNELDKLTHSGFYGPQCTVDTMSNYLGIDINYYARINFSSVINIIDALGGVDVYSEYEFYTYPLETFIQKGINHMDGKKALDFCRERYNLPNGDFDRIDNQTAVLKAIVDKITSPEILNIYKNLLNVIIENVETNMTSDDILSLVSMQLSDMSVWNIESYSLGTFGTYDYSAMMGEELYMGIPNLETVEKAKDKINKIVSEFY